MNTRNRNTFRFSLLLLAIAVFAWLQDATRPNPPEAITEVARLHLWDTYGQDARVKCAGIAHEGWVRCAANVGGEAVVFECRVSGECREEG
jgi:hypothetical protein